MTHATFPRHPCTRIVPDRRSPDTAQPPTSADPLESGIWPLLPLPAARALSVALLLVVVVGVLCAVAREARAQSTDILLSNAGPPASTRLLLVNVTQRQVAQEFTTGPHPAGYDIYAAAVRTEKSSGKRDMGLQGMIRNRRWEPVGPWNMMLPHRQVGPILTRSRPIADADWSWFMSSEPIHLEPNETYFFELVCRWGCFVMENGVGLGLTESNDEDDSTLPGWSMADGFMTQNTRFNRWWGDMVVGTDGFFHPNPQGPVLRLAFRGEPTEMDGLPSDEAGGARAVGAGRAGSRSAPRTADVPGHAERGERRGGVGALRDRGRHRDGGHGLRGDVRAAGVRAGADAAHGRRAGAPRRAQRGRGDAHPAPVGSDGGTARGRGGDRHDRQRRLRCQGVDGPLRTDHRVAGGGRRRPAARRRAPRG